MVTTVEAPPGRMLFSSASSIFVRATALVTRPRMPVLNRVEKVGGLIQRIVLCTLLLELHIGTIRLGLPATGRSIMLLPISTTGTFTTTIVYILVDIAWPTVTRPGTRHGTLSLLQVRRCCLL